MCCFLLLDMFVKRVEFYQYIPSHPRLSYFGTCLYSKIVEEVKKRCVFKYACTSKNNILFFKGLILWMPWCWDIFSPFQLAEPWFFFFDGSFWISNFKFCLPTSQSHVSHHPKDFQLNVSQHRVPLPIPKKLQIQKMSSPPNRESPFPCFVSFPNCCFRLYGQTGFCTATQYREWYICVFSDMQSMKFLVWKQCCEWRALQKQYRVVYIQWYAVQWSSLCRNK